MLRLSVAIKIRALCSVVFNSLGLAFRALEFAIVKLHMLFQIARSDKREITESARDSIISSRLRCWAISRRFACDREGAFLDEKVGVDIRVRFLLGGR